MPKIVPASPVASKKPSVAGKKSKSTLKAGAHDADGGASDADPLLLASGHVDPTASLAAGVSAERVAALQESMNRLLLQTDTAHTQALRQELLASIERETTLVKQALASQWETQRAALAGENAAFESRRAAQFKEMVDKEAQLHASQAELLKQYQQRISGSHSTARQLQELHEGNRRLKDELALLLEANRARQGTDVATILALQERLVDATAKLANLEAVASPFRLSSQPRIEHIDDNHQKSDHHRNHHHHHHHRHHRPIDSPVAQEPPAAVTPPAAAETPRSASPSPEPAAPSPPPAPVPQNLDAVGKIHVNLLEVLLREVQAAGDPVRSNQATGYEVYAAFEDSLTDLYEALCFKHTIPISPYRETMKSFLVKEEPRLVCATDVICYLYEGREAEFADFVLLESAGRRTATMKSWLKVVPGDDSAAAKTEKPLDAFYFSTISMMSQRECPATPDLSKNVIATYRQCAFSSTVPGSDGRLAANPTLAQARAPDLRTLCTTLICGAVMRNIPAKMAEVERQLAHAGPREWEIFFTLQDIIQEQKGKLATKKKAQHQKGQ